MPWLPGPEIKENHVRITSSFTKAMMAFLTMKHVDRLADKCTCIQRQKVLQADRKTDGQEAGRQIGKQTGRQAELRTDGEAGRKSGRECRSRKTGDLQTGCCTGGQATRQINRS